MIYLIKKDIVIWFNNPNTLSFVCAGVMVGIFRSVAADVQTESLLLITTLALFASISSFSRDELNQSERIILSLPIEKRKIVMAKYAGMFVFMGVVILYSIILLFIMKLLGYVGMNEGMINIILTMIFIVGVLNSIMFPLYFKMGYHGAELYNSLFYLFYILFALGLMSDVDRTSYIQNIFIDDWRIHIGLLIIMLLMVFISMKISIGFYEEKEV